MSLHSNPFEGTYVFSNCVEDEWSPQSCLNDKAAGLDAKFVAAVRADVLNLTDDVLALIGVKQDVETIVLRRLAYQKILSVNVVCPNTFDRITRKINENWSATFAKFDKDAWELKVLAGYMYPRIMIHFNDSDTSKMISAKRFLHLFMEK